MPQPGWALLKPACLIYIKFKNTGLSNANVRVSDVEKWMQNIINLIYCFVVRKCEVYEEFKQKIDQYFLKKDYGWIL